MPLSKQQIAYRRFAGRHAAKARRLWSDETYSEYYRAFVDLGHSARREAELQTVLDSHGVSCRRSDCRCPLHHVAALNLLRIDAETVRQVYAQRVNQARQRMQEVIATLPRKQRDDDHPATPHPHSR